MCLGISRFFMSTEQTRREAPNPPPPMQPFGINPNMQAPQQGFMMSPPPGFRPTQSAQQFMALPPGMVMMQQPPQPLNMNGPNQQGQSQSSRQEGPPMLNATTIRVPLVNSNTSRPNNNTRRETEQTTIKPQGPVTQKPFTESPLGIDINQQDVQFKDSTLFLSTGNDKQESDGSNMKKPQAPPNPFVPPHPMPIPMPQFTPFNPMMMNQPPLFIDPMGRLMMLVPVDPSRFAPPFAQGSPQQAVPQGPPVPGMLITKRIQLTYTMFLFILPGQPFTPMQVPVPLGPFPFGTVPPKPDISKQPPSSLRMADKNTTSS